MLLVNVLEPKCFQPMLIGKMELHHVRRFDKESDFATGLEDVLVCAECL